MGSSRESSAAAAAGELETARPQTAGEEDLQLQLALAMSREEAERDERRRRSDYVRLQLALSQSEQDFKYAFGHSNFLINLPMSFHCANVFKEVHPENLNLEATDLSKVIYWICWM